MSSFADLLDPVYERADARWLIPFAEAPALINSITTQCQQAGTHYVDHAFPPGAASLNRIPK
ncbi:hypothetical protein KIPB_014791, partial [Kipferlia bialata]|eukprot:g14791.t1